MMLCLKIAVRVAKRVDPDETPHSAVSHLDLHRMLRPVCPNTYGKYSIMLHNKNNTRLGGWGK